MFVSIIIWVFFLIDDNRFIIKRIIISNIVYLYPLCQSNSPSRCVVDLTEIHTYLCLASLKTIHMHACMENISFIHKPSVDIHILQELTSLSLSDERIRLCLVLKMALMETTFYLSHGAPTILAIEETKCVQRETKIH